MSSPRKPSSRKQDDPVEFDVGEWGMSVAFQPASGHVLKSRHPKRRGLARRTERMPDPLQLLTKHEDALGADEIKQTLELPTVTESQERAALAKSPPDVVLEAVHKKGRARAQKVYDTQSERLLPEHPICDDVWKQAKAQHLLQETKGGLGRIIQQGEDIVLPRNMTIPVQKREFRAALELPLMTDLGTAMRRYGAPGAKVGESVVLEQKIALAPIVEAPASGASTSSASSAKSEAVSSDAPQLAASMCVESVKAKLLTGDGKQSLALRTIVTGLLPTEPPFVDMSEAAKKTTEPEAVADSKEAKVEEKKDDAKAPSEPRVPKWHAKLYARMKEFLQGSKVPALEALTPIFDSTRDPEKESKVSLKRAMSYNTIGDVVSKANGFSKADIDRFLAFEAVNKAGLTADTRLADVTAEQRQAVSAYAGYTFCEPVRKALLLAIPLKEETKTPSTSVSEAVDDGVKLEITAENLVRARQIEHASMAIARHIYRVLRAQGLYDEVVLSNKSEPALVQEKKSTIPLARYHEITRVLEKATRDKVLPAAAGKAPPKTHGTHVECLSIDAKTQGMQLRRELDDILRTGFGDTGDKSVEIYRDTDLVDNDKMRSLFIDAESRCVAYVATLLQYAITHKGLPEIAQLKDILRREDLPTQIPAMNELMQQFSNVLSDELMKSEKLWPGSYLIACLPDDKAPTLFENPITALTVYRTKLIAEGTVIEYKKSLKDSVDAKKYARAMCVRDPKSKRIVALVYTLRAAMRSDEVFRTACHLKCHVLTDSLRALFFAPTPSSPVQIADTGVQAPVSIPVYAKLELTIDAHA